MDLLTHLIELFADNGYMAVFLALLLCGAGVPIPEDVTLVAGGVIAGLGHANVHVMFVVAMGGVLIGDATMFLLGRHLGARLLQRAPLKWILTPKRYKVVQKQFERYGNRLLFTARFLPGMRAAVFVSAGLTRQVSCARFLLLDGMAALISVPIWVYLGFFGANNQAWLLKWMHRGQAGLWIALTVLVVGLGIYIWRCRQRDEAKRAEDGSA